MAKTKQVLLIDGDIVAFNSIVASFEEIQLEDEDGHSFIHYMTDFTTAYNIATAQIEAIRQACGGGSVIFTWTDYTSNWRNDVLPSYKAHRRKADSIRPAGLIKLKEKLAEDYESYCWPSLEADDVMGILATDDSFYPDFKKIIVSEDKDMKTIPAWIYNPAKDYQPWLNDEPEADLFFLSQALGGDVIDGYSGCSGISQERGYELLKGYEGVESYEHTFKSGARKGLTEVRWSKKTFETQWEALISHYLKAGLSEDFALSQARVARILRSSDYDKRKQEVILWTP